jgi:hypothetical protein
MSQKADREIGLWFWGDSTLRGTLSAAEGRIKEAAIPPPVSWAAGDEREARGSKTCGLCSSLAFPGTGVIGIVHLAGGIVGLSIGSGHRKATNGRKRVLIVDDSQPIANAQAEASAGTGLPLRGLVRTRLVLETRGFARGSRGNCDCGCPHGWFVAQAMLAKPVIILWTENLRWLESIEDEITQLRIQIQKTHGRPAEDVAEAARRVGNQVHRLLTQMVAKQQGNLIADP